MERVGIPFDSWRNQIARLSFVGEICMACEEVIFPPRDLCPLCGKNGILKDFQLSGKGTVISFTSVADQNVAPAGFEYFVPYLIGLIKLEEGPTVTARITDVGLADVDFGMQVELVTRVWRIHGEKGQIEYGFAARPLLLAT